MKKRNRPSRDSNRRPPVGREKSSADAKLLSACEICTNFSKNEKELLLCGARRGEREGKGYKGWYFCSFVEYPPVRSP